MKRLLILMGVAALVMGFAMTASAAPIGNSPGPGDVNVTGHYYQYALFPSGSGQVYRGGGDVDGYGNTLYVNRDGDYMDVYTVTLLDSDGDGNANEPDQHPDNIGPDDIPGTADDAIGPIEDRTLTYVRSYYVPGLKVPTTGCLYATSDRVYYLDGSGISYVLLSDGSINSTSVTTGNYSQLGYDDVNGVWYASSESARKVYSWTGASWQFEFEYPTFGGSHMDGLEVVTDPATNIPYVYVSDMTSDYLGQYRYDTATSSWVQQNLFAYAGTAGNVEGMGFGPLGHFWATTGFANTGSLYEIGGGSLGGYTPPPEPVPEPATLLLLGTGLVALAGLAKKRKFFKG